MDTPIPDTPIHRYTDTPIPQPIPGNLFTPADTPTAELLFFCGAGGARATETRKNGNTAKLYPSLFGGGNYRRRRKMRRVGYEYMDKCVLI